MRHTTHSDTATLRVPGYLLVIFFELFTFLSLTVGAKRTEGAACAGLSVFFYCHEAGLPANELNVMCFNLRLACQPISLAYSSFTL